jgi:hypothetical protein
MAPKKKKAVAKRKAAKSKTADKEPTDQEIFDLFGVGTETASHPLRKFISGQRRINGKLYIAIEKIVDSLEKKNGMDDDLQAARDINDGVPLDPPACNSQGLPGGGS